MAAWPVSMKWRCMAWRLAPGQRAASAQAWRSVSAGREEMKAALENISCRESLCQWLQL